MQTTALQQEKEERKRRSLRSSRLIWQILLPLATATTVQVCAEWIQRGSLAGVWAAYVQPHFSAYLISWMLLLFIYESICQMTRLHSLAVLTTGLLGCVPATVSYFKMKLRGEPFLPWDIAQVSEATDVVGKAGIVWQPSMKVSAALLALLFLASLFVRLPWAHWRRWLLAAAVSVAATAALLFGVFLQSNVTLALGIKPDMWMQDRYYSWYGVITAFLTNVQTLNIKEPENYSKETVDALVSETEQTRTIRQAALGNESLFDGCYKETADGSVTTPNILFIMDESFWDADELTECGVTYDTPLTPNLAALKETSAFGRLYSPSFGGGTCDVEFEALTGYSTAFLPSGCKPFQQHVTHSMFSLPQYLKEQGYQTAALHGYYKRFWSRLTAYPNLGIDRFVGLEDLSNYDVSRRVFWKSGLITDDSMATELIAMYEDMQADGQPVFLHTVTMQNHTSYTADNYTDAERVHVLEAPAAMSKETRGALEDFATGVRDADAMLGRLTAYFSQREEPVILVFWGDHYNPIGSSMEVYTSTGYASDDNGDPRVHGMPLLIWSNYFDGPVDIGTIGGYELPSVLLELYGLDKPAFYEYLTQQLYVYRSRTLGVTVEPDNTTSEELTDKQLAWNQNHWLLQYDLMFGEEYQQTDAEGENAGA